MNHIIVCPECHGTGILDTAIGSQMRRARKRKRLSLREAAAWIPISHSTLRRFEQGKTLLCDEYLRKLTIIYGIEKSPEPASIVA